MDVAAAEVLGRPHRVSGVVIHGAGRGGRDLGYPTANLDLPEYTAVPVDGVYAGWFTVLDDGPVDGTIVPGRRYPSAISVGTNPTFGDAARSVEAFVLDESADLFTGEVWTGRRAVRLGPAHQATGNPQVRDAITRVQRAATAAGVVAGIHAGDGMTGKELAALGFQIITLAPESQALRRGAAAHLDDAAGPR